MAMDSASSVGVDRRTSKRVRSRFTVRYRNPAVVDSVEQCAETTDISSNGLAFESPVSLVIGSQLDLQVDLPTLVAAIKTGARVTRLQELEEGKCYLIGVTFHPIPESYAHAIEAYVETLDVDRILRRAVAQNASDVHLVADRPPICRIAGTLVPLDMPPLSATGLERMLMSMMSDLQREQFARNMELDFSHMLPDGTRFRINVHIEMGRVAAALRLIPTKIRSLQELGLPSSLARLADLRQGMVLVTGPAGSGKSTTLASLIDLINRQRNCMIISIEDPIEYVYSTQRSVIQQREVGIDTHSFSAALKHVLRQDPNVILIGEIRDLDSISLSITAAATGHLVFTSLHATSAAESISRIIDVYPANQQTQIRNQLAECLQVVVGQVLVPRKDGTGLVVATEVLTCTPAIRNLIRKSQDEQIVSYIQSGSQVGMQLMDVSLMKLVTSGVVDFEVAKTFARNPAKFGL